MSRSVRYASIPSSFSLTEKHLLTLDERLSIRIAQLTGSPPTTLSGKPDSWGSELDSFSQRMTRSGFSTLTTAFMGSDGLL